MKTIFLIVSLTLSYSFYSQINLDLEEDITINWTPSDIKKLNVADNYFSNEEYLFARPIYDSLFKKHKTNEYISYLLGTCSIYDSRHQVNSESLIKTAIILKSKLKDYDYYLGKAYLVNDKFTEAIEQFEKYKLNSLSKEKKADVDHQISICKSAISLYNKSAVTKITNIGAPINSSGSEYTPVLSSNESFMVFTYRGERSLGGKQKSPNVPDEKNGIYFEDVMISYKDEKNNWTEPKPISTINTTGHDAVVYISRDGQKLFIYRNIGVGSGDIFISKLEGLNWSVPEKIKGINSNFWEGSICLSPDEKTIYFSSERPGGKGKRDIYSAQLLADGSWGNVKNLGPEINTEYDEDSPFMHSDGRTLFFSSTGHNTMGGYDIFKSELKQGKWTTPYNVGKPVNSSEDDKYYVVSNDGERGYYSSEKKTGLGEQDIYIVEPGLFGKPTALVMALGMVTYSDTPISAKINVRSKLNKKDFSGVFYSNSITGKYLVNLPAGNEYEIIYHYKNVTITKSISTAKIDSFAKLEIDVDLLSELNNLITDSLADKADDFSNLGLSYDQLLTKYGNTVIEDLFYYIQIGAFKIPENFNYSKLIGLPKVERKIFSDNITRFILGKYKTLNEAEIMLLKAKKNGTNDAFIITIYKGEKYYFTELINQNILK